MNASFTEKLDWLKMPRLAALSLGLSVLQAILQVWWKAIRYSNFGPRPFTAKLFLIVQGIVLMFAMVEGISTWQWSDQDRDKLFSLTRTPNVRPFGVSLLWTVVAIAAWILVTFVLG